MKRIRRVQQLAPLLILVWFALANGQALAHGARIAYETISTIVTLTVVEVQATYDSGEPMAGGQVMVYSPNNPKTPWQTGVCDDAGRYSFTPDMQLPGTWEVQVRQAGHGDVVYIPITGNPSTPDNVQPDTLPDTLHNPQSRLAQSGTTGYTPLQIVLMSGCVVWGFVGTALFFSRRKL